MRTGVSSGIFPAGVVRAEDWGDLLSRARDGVPQGACLPCTARQRHDLLLWFLGVGVAGGNGPLRRGMEDGSLIAGCNRGGNSLPQQAVEVFALCSPII